MNEILLYFALYPYIAEEIVTKIIEAGDNDYTIRMATDGGDVDSGKNIIARMQESKGIKTCMIDSKAYSMGGFMLPFFDVVKAYSHSTIMIHKAVYADYCDPSDEDYRQLKIVNDMFKAQLVKRGVNQDVIDKVFEPDVRNDVYLSAQEAFEAGLVDEVLELDVIERKKIDARIMTRVAACASKYKDVYPDSGVSAEGDANINKNSKKMTVQELESKHPELFAQVGASAIKAEGQRIKAWVAHLKSDDGSVNSRVIAGLKGGEDYDMAIMSELNQLMLTENVTSNVIAENPDGSEARVDVVAEAVQAVIDVGGDAVAISAAAIEAAGSVTLAAAAGTPAADAAKIELAKRNGSNLEASTNTVLGMVKRGLKAKSV